LPPEASNTAGASNARIKREILLMPFLMKSSLNMSEWLRKYLFIIKAAKLKIF
jgi:hypothetical protein